jgi:hypothetical protein
VDLYGHQGRHNSHGKIQWSRFILTHDRMTGIYLLVHGSSILAKTCLPYLSSTYKIYVDVDNLSMIGDISYSLLMDFISFFTDVDRLLVIGRIC